jgi:hypothetical protein
MVALIFAAAILMAFLYFSAKRLDDRYTPPQEKAASDNSVPAPQLEAPLGTDAGSPAVEKVTARGLTAAPGAIVCPSLNKVIFLFHQYAIHWEDASQDALTGGASRTIRGDPTPAPDPALYGCTLVPPGTPMLMQKSNGIPAVEAKLVDGSIVKGVTLDGMINEGQEEPEAIISAGPASPSAQTPDDDRRTPFPTIHNSPDTTCDPGIQCSDEQFKQVLKGEMRRWELSPEWLRRECVSSETAPVLFGCMLKNTVAWLNVHPEAKAPWLNFDQESDASTQYTPAGPGTSP